MPVLYRQMEILLANLAAARRRSTLNGREYLIAPMSMLVPGVLAGSRGALYYPPEEVSKDPGVWNHMPIVVHHPVRDGVPVSARTPKVLEEQGLGFVFESNYDGKLAAEGWFDIERTRAYDSKHGTDIFNRLDAGSPIELSTGLYTENEPALTNSNHNGVAYQWIARNYKPDHLAVLPDQLGACSLKDGCGINVNSHVIAVNADLASELDELGVAYNARDGAGQFASEDGYDDEEEEEDDEKREEKAIARSLGKGKKKAKDVKSRDAVGADSAEAKSRVAKAREIAENELIAAVENAVPGQVKSAVTGWFKRYGAGYGKGPIHEAAQAGYMSLTDGDRELGGSARLQADEGHNPASWVEDEGTWDRAKAAADKGGYDDSTYWAVVSHIYKAMGGAVKATANQQGDIMNRSEKIAAICVNCACYKGKDKLLANKEMFSDADIDNLHAGLMTANANALVVNALKKDAGLTDDDLKANAFPPWLKKGKGKAEEEEEEDDEEEVTENLKLSADDQAVLNYGRETMKRDKLKLVTKLVANVKDEARRQKLGASLMTKNVEELQDLVSLLPAKAPARAEVTNEETPAGWFFGAGGPPPITNAAEDQDDIDSMTQPTTNYAELAKAQH